MTVLTSKALDSQSPERRTAPFDDEPGYYEPAKLWLYGNVRLLHSTKSVVQDACGIPREDHAFLEHMETEAEKIVLNGQILVCGVHNLAHQRAAIVPLRWGSPRIVVFSGGFYYHLGKELNEEPFRAARLWRYQWDPKTDLAISRRAPNKLPTFAYHNPTVDRLIQELVAGTLPGMSSPLDSLSLVPVRSA